MFWDMPMTQEDFEREINRLLVQIELRVKKAEKIELLLKQSLPYVIAHYERSRTGFGNSAKILMNQIKSVLGVK
jgi:putative transposon-encoded protein